MGLAVARGPSVDEIIQEFLEAVDEGSARDRYGRRFSAEAATELHWCLGGHVADALGAMSVDEVRRRAVETLVYDLADAGLSRRRLRALAKSVRAFYDYAAERVAIPDEDETEQPAARSASSADPALARAVADHAISLVLRVATLAFVITALVFLAESL